MPSVDDLSRLLQTLYSAVGDPPLWEHFLKQLVEVLGIPAAAILYQDLEHERHGFNVSVGVDPALMASYEQYYGKLDAFRPRFLAKAEGEIAFGEELCPTAELLRTEFYGDLLSKHDITLYGVVATVKQPRLVEHISLYRGWNGVPPRGSSLEFFRLVVPHLRIALRMRQELRGLQCQVGDLQAALHTLSLGIVLLDRQGRSLFVNQAAEAIFRATDGLRLRGGRLAAECASEVTRLQALIDSAIQGSLGRAIAGGGTCQISRRNGNPLRLLIQPLAAHGTMSEAGRARRAAVIVLLRAANNVQPSPPAALLRACYGLSPAEARLALQVYAGRSLASAAKSNDVSIGTVRAQLKAVFRKTGVGRQIDLQRLLQALSGEWRE